MICEITRPTGERECLNGVVVTCCAESETLRGFFLDLFDQALDSLESAPNEREIDSWIDHAARLFAELEEPPVREVRGLWGELFVIAEARNPETMIRRWHEDPDERFDFVAGYFVLEVKTCRDLERVHEFSLRQIRPRPEIDVIVASVPTYADPQGQSVTDLLGEIERRVVDDFVRAKLRETVFRSAGSSLAEANPRRFDRRAARTGLRFMSAAAVPALEECPPAEVLEVRLSIRCRDVPGIDALEMIEVRFGET